MFTTTVTDPRGARWEVSLQIIPHRQGVGFRERFLHRKSRAPNPDPKKHHWYDRVDLPVLDGINELWLLIAIIVVFIIFVFIGWPLLLLLTDFIWLIFVLVGA